jgi:hypothetical protein
VRPHARESGQSILKLRQFDLQTSFRRPRVLRENVQDQRCSIQDSNVEDLFEIPELRWGEFIVDKDNRVL